MPDTPATSGTKPDYRSTVFLPRTAFPMKAGLPQKEPAILARWQADDLYGAVRKARAGREKFILHDGPPYANGDIHIGHALNHILKDMVVRTQTLLGRDAPYVPGWDCHGLPIEWKVEEQYRKKKLDKDQVPLPEFRAECRAYAQHWVDTQREQLKRLGIGGDWDHPYLTMDFGAEATIVSELMKFAESGQIYRGAKPVMWSPVEKTALAEAEIEYEDVVSTQIDVAFEIVESPNCPSISEMIADGWGVYAVVWTTTPWTIPVNQALAYSPTDRYRIVAEGGVKRAWVMAEELWEEVAGRAFAYDRDVVKYGLHFEPLGGYPGGSDGLFAGTEWEGAIARHPMHHLGGFFARPRPFLPGEFVTTDTGTGFVHMAPDHGEDDFELCKSVGIDPVFAVEGDGKYREDWAWLGGQGSVINNKFNAPDGPICSDLREAGALLAAAADYQHSYPHSWRSKAKVIYRCTPQWFIGMDAPLVPPPTAGEGQRSAATQGEGLSGTLRPLPPLASGESPSPARGEGQKERALTRWENEGGHLAPAPSLRQLAMRAIADTRFVPDKGRNRIGSMVEGRPDWVISRQRAWGVPIALFVERKSGELLIDAAVNRRIVDAVREKGVDAWSDERANEYLGQNPDGSARDPADYERVTDILDVWFDSGCTHVFTLESGRWPDQRWPADLYLEGSDQHRGWFQSSLLESCGTRGRAPFDAVLTHGFTMDSKGMKMSKSLGNTINPLDLMKEHGADILRLWALSVDSSEDHRIGKEILGGVADQYRKLRNTFRYLLGALEGFSEAERVTDVAAMPELERYMLHLLAELDAKLRQAVADFDFNTYTRALADFANNDLSAFYFDIRKDSLYCDAASDPKRRAYRTVLDTMFHALVRWCAPVLVFTAEEVWATRFPDESSVHLLEWPAIGVQPDMGLSEKWRIVREFRSEVLSRLELLRREKRIGSSLEASISLEIALTVDGRAFQDVNFAEVCITSESTENFVGMRTVKEVDGIAIEQSNFTGQLVPVPNKPWMAIGVAKSSNHKCGRCWRLLSEVVEDGDLCDRCEGVVNG